MMKSNRMVDRRRFIATCGASFGAALICRPWHESLAEEIGRDEHRIADLEVIQVSGQRTRTEGVNHQHQVRPLHLYPGYRPTPWKDNPNPQEVTRSYSQYYLRITTQGGLEGFYGAVDREVVPVLLRQFRGFLKGQDALAGEAIWDRMYRSNRHSRAGHFMMALSCVDNALWDLRGRFFKAPVYRLLGGPTRSPVQVYGSCLGFSVEPERAVERARDLRDKGFRHQKWFLAYGPGDGNRGLALNVELVRALRESVGDDVDLMFDAFLGWDLDYAKRWASRVEEYHPAWIEEAFPVADVESFARFKQATSIPIATGEHFYNRWEVQQYLKADVLDYIQADPEWCGGATELVRICHLASVHGVKVVPHGHNIHAAMHVVASQSPSVCPLVEYLINSMPSKVWFEKHRLLTHNGTLALPDRPGFGIELDEERVDKMETVALS